MVNRNPQSSAELGLCAMQTAALLPESPGFCVLAGRAQQPVFLQAGAVSASSVSPVPVVQQGIAGLLETAFPLWGRQNYLSYSRSPPRLLKVFSLLA